MRADDDEVDMREERLKHNITAMEDEPDPQFQPWMMDEHFDRSKEEPNKSVALLNELGENAEAEAARWLTAQALLQQQRSSGAKQKMTPLEREALMNLADALTPPQPSPPPPERLAPGKKMKVRVTRTLLARIARGPWFTLEGGTWKRRSHSDACHAQVRAFGHTGETT